MAANRLLDRETAILVTPAMARAWLDQNRDDNRKVSLANVRKLAHAMKSGEWMINGETIKFDTKGRLLDGQHRLFAVLEADVSVYMEVRYGLDERAMYTIDTGKKRTMANAVQMAGHKNSSLVAGAINVILGYLNDDLEQTVSAVKRSATNIEAVEFAEMHPELAGLATKVEGLKLRSIGPPAMILGFFWIFSQRDSDMAHIFMEDLAVGASLRLDDPVFVLRERLLNNRASKSVKLTRRVMAALIIKAWNARQAGRSMLRLAFAVNEEFPEIA